MVRDNNLIDIVRKKVLAGTPYIGWSAGSNVACPTIRTTNDMPVVEPDSFRAFNLIPFQINPHYLDANPAGHAGETREQCLFVKMKKSILSALERSGFSKKELCLSNSDHHTIYPSFLNKRIFFIQMN